ncbi:MAG: iron ABC transporter permease [Clostridia bacterium]|nr:iron ABC transporter permease [Clostridia bacterium]
MKNNSRLGNFFTVIIMIMLAYFCLMPVINVIIYGVAGEGKPLAESDILRLFGLLRDSTMLALGVTLASVFFGIVSTITLYRMNFRGRGFIRVLMLLPLVNPSFVGSISFIMLFGKMGLITHDILGLSVSPFGWHGVFFLQVLGSTTIAYLIISSAVRNTDISVEEAARNLGADERTVFMRVTLPMMIPEITSAALLVFLGSMADFTTPLIIGGKFRTLASDLYIQITGLYNMKMASITGIFLLIPCFMAFYAQRKFSKRRKFNLDQHGGSNVEYTRINKALKALMILKTCMVISVFAVNIIFIFVGAFTVNWGYDYTFTLKHFKTAFSVNLIKYLKPLINSITLSVITGIVSSLFGVILAYGIQRDRMIGKKIIDLMAMLPAAIPGILLGIGYLVTFKYPLFGIGKFVLKDVKPLILLGTTLIVYIACIFRNINISMKSCYALLEHVDSDIENASYNLGASKLQTYIWVIIPLLRDAFANSYIKVFSSTMTTLGVIVFLIMPKNKVIIQVLFQSMTGGLVLGVPAVLALTLSVITLALMLSFNVFVYGKEGIRKMGRGNR